MADETESAAAGRDAAAPPAGMVVQRGPARRQGGLLLRGPDIATLPSISLHLLGGFLLAVDDRTVELPAGAQRLLAILALRGRMSRSRLAGTLWPDTAEHRALASLRTGIWRVNQTVERLVSSGGGTIDLEPAVRVDVRRIAGAARSAMRGQGTGLAAEVEVLFDDDGGELLPDWEDDWLMVDRERFRQLRLHVLEATAERLIRDGDFGLALEAALAALRADWLRESAHRVVIRIHLAEGNVEEARRAFETCRRMLVRDVGVEPAPATVALLAGRHA